ncbi:prepilin-type N-terminal cleavage/methylation domain-containing protein [bacterium]|nr:prepilin-type N-terminal cleavage/methylation domain-containing protein [bacterium]
MKKSGFTLIELLIVVAIIGILAAIAVPNFLNAQVRAKISRAQADLRSVRTAIEMYIVDHGSPILDPALIPNMRGGLDVWKALTTPVAYTSSGSFYDPFVPDTNPFTSSAGWESVADGVYHYRNVQWQRKVNNQGAATNADKNARYLARSPGPDRWYITSPQRLAIWMAFDPSNGLRSIGDIIMADKGILGVNFAGQKTQPGTDGGI